jgi:hypothetical protein
LLVREVEDRYKACPLHEWDFHFQCCTKCMMPMPADIECTHQDWDDINDYCRSCGFAAACAECGGCKLRWYCSNLHKKRGNRSTCRRCQEDKVDFTRPCTACGKLCCAYCLRKCSTTHAHYCNACHSAKPCRCVSDKHRPEAKPVPGCRCGCNATPPSVLSKVSQF